jgi:hypothetical protein
MKTGDLQFVKDNFTTEGPTGESQPSIEDAAHVIAADRSGPSGIMEETNDIDTNGYWTTDDFAALLGLAAYRYLAQHIGDLSEAAWAMQQYNSLLAATNSTLDSTIARYRLDYLPCSMLQPNSANRCVHPEDANWSSPFGNWAWEGYLLGATRTGPGITMIDATYAYGFERLRGKLPLGTFGGFPDDYYSSGYNAANGSTGLASKHFRDQGILGYEFMIANSQSGPYSWWESSTAPSARTPWIGRHPAAGQGSSPHAWGIAGANKVLLDSLVAQRSDVDRGSGCARQLAGPWRGHRRDEFPDDEWEEDESQNLLERPGDLAQSDGSDAFGPGSFPNSVVRRQHRRNILGCDQSSHGHSDIDISCEGHHCPAPQGSASISPVGRIGATCTGAPCTLHSTLWLPVHGEGDHDQHRYQ